MARIRTIKPDFWTSEDIAKLSYFSRLLFIGLWNHCDDTGRCLAHPQLIKAALFPLDDDMDSPTIHRALGELSGNGQVQIYTVNRKVYLQVVAWHHQKIEKVSKSRFPGPEMADDLHVYEVLPDSSPTPPRLLPGQSSEFSLVPRTVVPSTPPISGNESGSQLALVPEQGGVATAPPASQEQNAIALEVFNHWKDANHKTERVDFSTKRIRLIERTVKTYGLDAVKRAIDNNATDTWAISIGKHELEYVLGPQFETWRDKRPAPPVQSAVKGWWLDGGSQDRKPEQADLNSGRYTTSLAYAQEAGVA